MTSANFMVIGLQIGKLHRGGGGGGGENPLPSALPDSEKPGLFRINFHVMSCSLFSACSEVHNSTVGSISSLGFPSNYPNYAICHYLITNTDPAARITLTFIHFELESHKSCNYDSVKIYDGNSSSATNIGRTHGYCGKRAPPTLTIASTGNSLLIVFISDKVDTRSGFNATYRGKMLCNPNYFPGS